jgi:1,2-diacylglycerol 3-alpha-glucosyltransferase
MPKIKDELVAFGVKKPIVVIPSGVDLEKFGKQKKGFLRKKTGIQKGKILLYVGRLGNEKSVDFLIKAFQKVHDKDPLANMVLVGDGPEKENLKQLTKVLNIERNVYFTGLIDQKDISKVYTDASVFVFASQTETQGIVILEALASGLPVVAINDAVYDGIIKNKMNGILVSNDTDQFANECLSLLNTPSYRRRLSEHAQKSGQKFSVAKTAQALENLYKKLIPQHSKENFYGRRI